MRWRRSLFSFIADSGHRLLQHGFADDGKLTGTGQPVVATLDEAGDLFEPDEIDAIKRMTDFRRWFST